MKTTIGIYNSHSEGIDAVKTLKDAGIPGKHLSLIGKVDENGNLTDKLVNAAGTEVGAGVLIGSTLGVLTGVGIFAIPGLGFLYGAGALVGAIAGFDFGLIGGGLISALTLSGVHEDAAKQYEKELNAGKFILIAHGPANEIEEAKAVLQSHGKHTTLETH